MITVTIGAVQKSSRWSMKAIAKEKETITNAWLLLLSLKAYTLLYWDRRFRQSAKP